LRLLFPSHPSPPTDREIFKKTEPVEQNFLAKKFWKMGSVPLRMCAKTAQVSLPDKGMPHPMTTFTPDAAHQLFVKR
jgi:hypothetical protein